MKLYRRLLVLCAFVPAAALALDGDSVTSSGTSPGGVLPYALVDEQKTMRLILWMRAISRMLAVPTTFTRTTA